MSQITVLGIGNILLKDEGFGVKVVDELQKQYRFPASVQLLDGGTLGMELMRFISGTKKLLLIDAVDGGSAPGTFYRFTGEEVKNYFQEKVSLHELGIKDLLMALELLEQPVEETVILGVEPESLDLGLELTDTVAAVVPTAITAALEQLAQWQVEVTAHE